MKISAALGPAFSVLILPVAAAAQERAPYYGPHHMWGDGWHGWFFGPLLMFLFFVALVVTVVVVARWLGGMPGHHGPLHRAPPGQTPLDILKERFARGEIDKQEFEERRRVLSE